MSDHVSYPMNFPLQCAIDVTTLVRAGNVKDHIPELGLHLWNIQGYMQRVTLGVPASDTMFGSNPLIPGVRQFDEFEKSLPALLEALPKPEESAGEETKGKKAKKDKEEFGAAAPAAAIDPATVLLLIQMASQIYELIKLWRKK